MSNPGENCLTDALLLRALDEELPPPQTWQVNLHLESCESCQARLDRLRSVSSRLAELHQIAMPPDATCEFAARLAKASREPHWTWPQWFAHRRPLWQKLAWGGAVAVVILAGVKVLTTHPPAPVQQVFHPVRRTAAPPAPLQVEAEIPVQARRARHIVRKRVPREQFSAPARASTREIATPFFDLPFSDAALPLDQATVIRVELPRSALELAGLPVDEDRRNQRIRADLVLGADGLARAIRFVE